jgi:hypothetical protein
MDEELKKMIYLPTVVEPQQGSNKKVSFLPTLTDLLDLQSRVLVVGFVLLMTFALVGFAGVGYLSGRNFENK